MFIGVPGVSTTNTSPARSATGQRRQAEAARVDVAEELAVGDADEVTLRVVGPVVVRAREATSVPVPSGTTIAPRWLHSLTNARTSPFAPRVSSTGTSITFIDLYESSASQLAAEGEHQRQAFEQRDLVFPARRIEVSFGRHAHHRVGLRRRVAGPDVHEVVPGHGDELASVGRCLGACRGSPRGTGRIHG